MVCSFVEGLYGATRRMDQVPKFSNFATFYRECLHEHPSGAITLGDILEILPFEDPIVVLELDGEALWAALESALSTWPAQEGCVTHLRLPH